VFRISEMECNDSFVNNEWTLIIYIDAPGAPSRLFRRGRACSEGANSYRRVPSLAAKPRVNHVLKLIDHTLIISDRSHV
jgi:hypothetical protein